MSITTPHFGSSRTRKVPKGRVFTFKTLPEKGIDFHPNHVRRLVRAGRFPKPIYLSWRRPVWLEDELDRWIDGKIAEHINS
jgi:prophage regulatory protein